MAGYFGLLDTSIGKNSFYRFINNERYDWRKLQYGVAKAYVKNVKKETKANSATKHDVEELKFYVADDTTIQKTGKNVHLLRNLQYLNDLNPEQKWSSGIQENS